jgi:hypothetical protein
LISVYFCEQRSVTASRHVSGADQTGTLLLEFDINEMKVKQLAAPCSIIEDNKGPVSVDSYWKKKREM